ncbi:MAG: transglycosylase SLT domain-containing protein [Alphaproteobacteria bacterium]|nr:transglycosylase SLT domain-containing protein [Alphaproteobacteria bacterium]
MIEEKKSSVDTNKIEIPAEQDTAFQKMMSGIVDAAPAVQDADDEHDNTSHVLISNNGKDFYDGKSSIRNAAFQRMMHGMGHSDDDSADLTQEEKEVQKNDRLKMFTANLWQSDLQENIRLMLEAIAPDAAQFHAVLDRFSSKFHGYDDDTEGSSINSFSDAAKLIDRRAYYGSHGRNGSFSGAGAGPSASTSTNTGVQSDFKLSPIKISIGDRQLRVNDAIAQASEVTGVPADLSKGLWGVESSFGKNRLSPTGCLGDWQFTKGTFKSVIKQHGHEIPGLQKALKEVNGDVLALRDHPEISTYASQFYVKDLAEGLGLDVREKSNWGTLYAAYNVGPGGVKKLLRLAEQDPDAVAKDKLGFVAKVNPMFYVKGATASEALNNYQVAVETRLQDHKRAFGDTEPAATVVASAKSTGAKIVLASDEITSPKPSTVVASAKPQQAVDLKTPALEINT